MSDTVLPEQMVVLSGETLKDVVGGTQETTTAVDGLLSQLPDEVAVAVTLPPAYKSDVPRLLTVQLPDATVAELPICVPSMNSLITSPFVPEPLTEEPPSKMGLVVMATAFVVLVPTVIVLEKGLVVPPDAVALAEMISPVTKLIPVPAVHVPFEATVVVEPWAVPFL